MLGVTKNGIMLNLLLTVFLLCSLGMWSRETDPPRNSSVSIPRKWPGQVVIGIFNLFWTLEVNEAFLGTQGTQEKTNSYLLFFFEMDDRNTYNL